MPASQRAAQQRIRRQAGLLVGLLLLIDQAVGAWLEPRILLDNHVDLHPLPAARSPIPLYRALAAAPDVLLLGNSRIEAGISPHLLLEQAQPALAHPLQILNLALFSSTPVENYWLLKNIIRPDKQPAVILYGAAEYEFNANTPLWPSRYRHELATLADYAQVFPDPTQHIEDQFDFLLEQGWRLYRYRAEILPAVYNLVWPDPPPTGLVRDSYGWLGLDFQIAPTAIVTTTRSYLGANGLLRDYTLDGLPMRAFAQFLQLAQIRHIRVIVLNMPVVAAHQSLLPPATYAAYRARIQQVAARYGASIVDYNDPARWQEATDFADTNHLNRTGATKLSARVAQEVLIPALRAAAPP